jgi:hypothetical protein
MKNLKFIPSTQDEEKTYDPYRPDLPYPPDEPYKARIIIYYGPISFDPKLLEDPRRIFSELEKLIKKTQEAPILRIHPNKTESPPLPKKKKRDFKRNPPKLKYREREISDDYMAPNGGIDPISGVRVFYVPVSSLPRTEKGQALGMYDHLNKTIYVGFDGPDPKYVYDHEIGHAIGAKRGDFSEDFANAFARKRTGREPNFRIAA